MAAEFDNARHTRFFQRNLKSLLPNDYAANDSSRVLLCFFIVAALDLLSSPSSYSSDVLQDLSEAAKLSLISTDERKTIRGWLLRLQHTSGGFCGSPHHAFPPVFELREGFWNGERGSAVVPVQDDGLDANIAGTYFALLLLGLTASDDGSFAFRGVHRRKTLKWLKRLQRPDGSFGETVRTDGTVAGGRDMRFCYMAAGIRWMLRGYEVGDGNLDVDVEALVAHIRKSQTFDGGLSDVYMGESHAGYAYCGIAALSFLDISRANTEQPTKNYYLKKGIRDLSKLVHWLVSRQFEWSKTGDAQDPHQSSEARLADEFRDLNSPTEVCPTQGSPDLNGIRNARFAQLSLTEAGPKSVGFNGRLNKDPDTCYTWWVAGALTLLGKASLIDQPRARRFLLEETQHLVGGFGKYAGNPPDLYHSYLALAALSTLAGDDREQGIGTFDVRLCIGKEAAERIRMASEGFPAKADDDDGEATSWTAVPAEHSEP